VDVAFGVPGVVAVAPDRRGAELVDEEATDGV